MATDKIKVAVRVRPFNRRELELGTQCVVEMEGQQTILHNVTSMDKMDRKQPKTFAFDHCFFSTDYDASHFASQETVFDSVGRDILDNAFQGYNACIFAYGQTGSGKSYTMMGTGDNKGIIPRLCDELFYEISHRQTPDLSYKVEVSYMEIYNEKVHDLLDPKPNKQSLRVREHNVLGPYVDGLSQLAVTSFLDIDSLMAEGNKSRTVAATNMNAESSRSHAVFSVVLTQTLTDRDTNVSGEKVSRMSLVDLAGSERAVKTGAVGDRLKEGSNINKSLTTLGLVISKLADQSSGKTRNDKFVPYRDSVLTWLLKDNLGGNSRTVMVATISPAADNYEETLSTLRYADRAKRIVNHAVINEDPNARIIRELRREVETLREMLKHATGSPVGDTQRGDIHDKLAESENLMKQISQTWEEKLVKTERIQNERQQALEKMGISVQASGIMVEKNKYYLVNLNADPSLNELLVYYLKERTLVGGRSVAQQPDIQLLGLGIQPEHCTISIEDGGLFMEPISNARCCVNGVPVADKTPLHNGDRILWGNHHFFRVNCPKGANQGVSSVASEPQTPAQPIDYNFAREELMQNELSNDPIQTAIAQLERQHEEDKQVALEKQRQEYEKQFQQLRNILSPSTPYAPYAPYDPLRMGKITPCTPTTQMRMEKWAQERDEMFRRSLGQLKADIMRANALVQEANVLAEEMEKKTKFSVTLQIPPANLSPNRRRGAFVSEPAILVRRMNQGSQIWSMEKLENKLIDMREMYQEFKDRPMSLMPIEEPPELIMPDDDEEDESKKAMDPFYESQENHNLIGVANIFLEVLFHDVKLDYHTPIISQQGEVAGRLQVEVTRIAGQMPQDRMCETGSDNSSEASRDDDYGCDPMGSQITCRVSIKQATGLPISLSNYVFCQYTFWGHQETVVPVVNSELISHNENNIYKFEHVQDYTVQVSEEFLEHAAEGALSIEVWGHRSMGFSQSKEWEVEHKEAKARSLVDRWAELSRKIELWVEIHELNDNGEYTPVEVANRNEVLTGGVYQVRQGQQRRIQVRVKPVQNSGTLPIICQSILSIAVGSVTVRSRLQKPLDSYQEEDLTVLRDKWSEALGRRRQYLDQQIQKLINKEEKCDEEKERELSLVHQWVSLTEERNAVLVPAPGSGIPGAPASWDPSPGMEPHVPVLFLDLNADDLSTQNATDELSVVGLNSILPKEHGNKFYTLQILQHLDKDICAIASWDSSMHDSQSLNRVTEANERIYLILKTTVRLSHPAPINLVLRKRLALNIYKRQSLTDRIKKFRLGRFDNTITQTGVTYEVVSNIPKASEELEERESLAQIAAKGEDCSASDGETYIEKYTKGVSAVESILTLDRLRQSVAVKELEQAQGQPLSMRKTVSVPNFSQAVKETANIGGIMRFDTSMESLITVGRSESFADLNNPEYGVSRSFMASQIHRDLLSQTTNRDFGMRNRHSFGGKAGNEETMTGSGKPFGIARPTFLNLNLNLNSLRLQQPTKPSPANSKLGGFRMTTLHEEPLGQKALLEEPEDSYSDPEYGDYESYEVKTSQKVKTMSRMTGSRTMDSLMDIGSSSGHLMNFTSTSTSSNSSTTSSNSSGSGAAAGATALKSAAGVGTPSMSSSASSGYGSQAVSLGNLTSDDALSLRSMSVDETPDLDRSSSASPPTRGSAKTDVTTPYTPSGGQKRVNPFLKDMVVVEPTERKPLTPTREHPLQDLAEEGKNSDEEDDEDYPNKVDINENRSTKAISREDDSGSDGSGKRSNGQVVKRKKSQNTVQNNSNRASSETDSSDKMEDESQGKAADGNVPDWVVVGESVLIRPYNTSGVISFVGGTHFQGGTWVGVELDTPTGKNDGTVQGITYFTCKPKHGIFVRADKLILDKRGRAMRTYKAEKLKGEEKAKGRSDVASVVTGRK
ncbi:kinesin-like protein KIF13B isoform X4 [Phlebotomus argentipes]|uniref:kinesin-like protein KIF13B isoform X4 n=1 Tax=Phlebotomus argentipes TaxID=94469 RepID=UPI0028930CC7|nr:kinesin-like protein KIF13B isoform X4 [Phlebotomus argentipes]